MQKLILVAGATGNLGHKICLELINKNILVRAIVREESEQDKIDSLEKIGVDVFKLNFSNEQELIGACAGVSCVVSVLAGLQEVIVETQTKLLNAAVAAGVPRFIPSDFSTDFTLMSKGENRNFDLRRTFRSYIDEKNIQPTSIFNGAFADILKYNTPILNLKNRSIAYWGDKSDWKLDFTTMDNTAAFTAVVALQNESPRDLHIASFQISPKTLKESVRAISGQDFTFQKLSDLNEFSANIKKQRSENPSGEQELYAKWQQAQYMYSMFTTQHPKLDNKNYVEIEWTSGDEYLKSFLK